MQISKKQLQSIINEETERVRNEQDQLESLLEGYAKDYDSDGETVSKDALIDFLHVLDENKIPLAALEAFMENLPEQSVTGILSEVVDLEEMYGPSIGGDPSSIPNDPEQLKKLILNSVKNPADKQRVQQLIDAAENDVTRLRDLYDQITKSYSR